ncbi:MAG: xanthine dehydrogenase family protein subunit M [Paucimonas sp.]|jgi:xanthine dehydrogenase YagS FAD-binding subunit|nr:xanthine dehydrogenase family protein subunit M [Paucimonas sp.]
MTPFAYSKPTTIERALQQVGPHARFIAGGTNLLDLMKENVEHPAQLIDITALPLRDVTRTSDGGLSIGALVSNADLAWHPEIESRYPLLAQAILAGASPQLRNMASTGGNLLQRTRCHYFYDAAVPCNKRQPGSGCPARDGLNRQHAILGASEHCVAVHPSDLCVALAALEARVQVRGKQGERHIPFADFHRLPGTTPQRDNCLGEDELIVAIELPPPRFAGSCRYLKIRDRASYAFALVSVAAALEMDEQQNVVDMRVALGGVAHKPWRDPALERSMHGRPATRETWAVFADALLREARPLAHNGFKLTLAKNAIIRVLCQAQHGEDQP